RMAHVAHARSRRKVYELTHTGQEIARKMRDHARSRTVQLNETGGLREVPGSEAIEALRRTGLRESDAVQHVLAADVIEVPRPKAVITRPAYDPVEAIAVLRSDLSGCIVAIDDLHTCPAADGLLRPLVEDPVPAKILVGSRVHPGFYERSDVLRGRVVEMTLAGLDEAASGELLRCRGAPAHADALHRVVASTHGHPFALELFAASG